MHEKFTLDQIIHQLQTQWDVVEQWHMMMVDRGSGPRSTSSTGYSQAIFLVASLHRADWVPSR